MAIPSRANKIGYARVSTPDQKLDAQLDALQQAGCGQMFSDQVSGTTADRPGWERLLAYVRPGDTVIVTELSRMTRSLVHLLEVMALFEHRTIALISLREHIDTATATGRCFLAMMGGDGANGTGTQSRADSSGAGGSQSPGADGGTAPDRSGQARTGPYSVSAF